MEENKTRKRGRKPSDEEGQREGLLRTRTNVSADQRREDCALERRERKDILTGVYYM